MTHLVTLDDWDSDGLPKKIECDCERGRDHHALDGPMPSPLRPWIPLTAEDRRKVGEWLDEFIKAMPTGERPAIFAKPVDWQAEIAGWERMIADMPPRRTEPIKLTPGQWAMLPHGDPRAAPPYAQPLGDLMGIPVVMVNLEGWGKPKRRPWWSRLLQWKREGR